MSPLAVHPSLDAWIAVEWDGRRPRVTGTPSWERRAAGQGHRAGWSWDGERLALSNDRYGMLPLYYWLHDGGIVVASTLVRLLALGAPRALDWDALAVFLQLGWYQGETTPFAHVRVLPPDSDSHWRDGKLHLSGGPTIVPPGPAISREEAISAYARLFTEAIEATAPAGQTIILPLSGGRDSRHILLALDEAGARPGVCITYGRSRRSPEWRSAAALTERIGVDHRYAQLAHHTLAVEHRKNQATDYASEEHGHYLTLVDAVADVQAERGGGGVLYDGIAGDVFSAGVLSSPEKLALAVAGEWKALARAMPLADARAVLHPDSAAQLPPLSRTYDQIAAELERHAGARNPLSSYLFWNRTRREIALAPFRMLSQVVPVHTPFLHPPLFEWLARLPGELVQGKAFHTATIQAAYPRAADVPFAEGFPAEPRTRTPWRTLARLAADAMAAGRSGRAGLRLHHGALLPRMMVERVRPAYGVAPRLLRFAYYVRDLAALCDRDIASYGRASADGR